MQDHVQADSPHIPVSDCAHMLQAELEDKERKHFRTKGGSDFEGKLLLHLTAHLAKPSSKHASVCTPSTD